MTSPLTIGAERRRHPVYRFHAIYWATVYRDGAAVAQLGPYRDRGQALFAAQSMKEHREQNPMMYERKSIQGISDLPGQGTLPECVKDRTGLAMKRAAEPLRPSKPQKPMDIGLFSDEASQLDLVEMLQPPTNEE
jgi:hypothetical protein